MTAPPTTTATTTTSERDLGFSLFEILIVVMIAGILATIAVFFVSGMTASASSGTCAIEQRILGTAIEAYFHENQTDTIAPTGTGDDRYEVTLRDDGFVRGLSDQYDVAADGSLIIEGDAPC